MDTGFVKIPKKAVDLWLRGKITPKDFKVLAYLIHSMNWKTGLFYVKSETVCEVLGICRQSFSTSKNKLIKLGCLVEHPSKNRGSVFSMPVKKLKKHRTRFKLQKSENSYSQFD